MNQVIVAVVVSIELTEDNHSMLRVEINSDDARVLAHFQENPETVVKVLRDAADASESQFVNPPVVVNPGQWTGLGVEDSGQNGVYL